MAANPFSEWTKMFGDFKSPVVDMTQVITSVKKDADMVTTMVQIGTENTQELGRRSTEIVKTNAQHAMKAAKDLANNTTPESAASKHADFAKTWLEYNVSAVRELMEMGTKSAQELFDVVNKRAAEKMKEISEVASHSAHTTSKKKAA